MSQVGIQCDRDEYRKLLKEKARLDREYDQLFRRALQYGAPPLSMDDDEQAGDARIPVYGYIGDLQQHRGDDEWVARSCTWQGAATLYEVTNPWSRDENDRGRTLVLPRQPYPDFRDDLASIDPADLTYPPGPHDESPWRARAAEATY